MIHLKHEAIIAESLAFSKEIWCFAVYQEGGP